MFFNALFYRRYLTFLGIASDRWYQFSLKWKRALKTLSESRIVAKRKTGKFGGQDNVKYPHFARGREGWVLGKERNADDNAAKPS
jgi:hypothetical protein